jgi:hypothetical protein
MGKVLVPAAAFAVALFVLFQNCSPVQMRAMDDASLNGLGDPQVICDPFAAQSGCQGTQGVKGNLYVLPRPADAADLAAAAPTLNAYSLVDYIRPEHKLNVLIKLSELNIPAKDWASGFPVASDFVRDPNGNVLNEYFGVELEGFLKLPSGQPEGDYQLAVFSDDGSKLWIDSQLNVDNDGTHSPQWKCASSNVNLKVGELHSFKLQYYQGPRTKIALQVFLRPASASSQSCDENGGFSLLPGSYLFSP